MQQGRPLDSSRKDSLNTKLRKRRQLSYLKGLRKEIEEVSEKHNIDAETVVEMIDELFVDMRKLMTSPKMPVIHLHSFAIFKPSIKAINFYISRFIQLIKTADNSSEQLPEGKYERLKKKIEVYWAVRQRFIAEKIGIRTWYCWRDLPEDLKGYGECHKPTPKNCHKCYEERK